MPLAVSATTRRGRRASTSMNDTTWSTKSASRFSSVRRPARSAGAGPRPARTSSVSGLIAPRSTGKAPAWHSLMPLYSGGLCEAVNIAAGRRRLPEA